MWSPHTTEGNCHTTEPHFQASLADARRREMNLSPAGVCQRSLKMWHCSVTIALCSVRWPQSQPLFTMFHADLSHYRIGNVQKRTAARTRPPQVTAKSCSVTSALCSVRWPQGNAVICMIFSRIVTLQHRTSFL